MNVIAATVIILIPMMIEKMTKIIEKAMTMAETAMKVITVMVVALTLLPTKKKPSPTAH